MKKLSASLFIIIGLLILVKIGFQSVIGLVIGIAAMGVGVLLLVLKTKKHQSLHPSNSDEIIQRLKEEGERIEVVLDQCMISDNTYAEENDLLLSSVNYVPALITGYMNSAIDRKNVSWSVVRYRTFYKGQERIFVSPTLPFDKKNLVFGFTLKEKSVIYVDKVDPTVYYFDLEFMFEQPGL